MKNRIMKLLAIMLVFAMSSALVTCAFAAQDIEECAIRIPGESVASLTNPTAYTYKDNSGNTWGFLFASDGTAKRATVYTFFQLDKVYDSTPDTWDQVKAVSKTISNVTEVQTWEGGVDTQHCNGQKSFTNVTSGSITSSYEYLSTVVYVHSTHMFSYTFKNVYSTFSRTTVN